MDYHKVGRSEKTNINWCPQQITYKNECENKLILPRGGKQYNPDQIPAYKFGIRKLYPNIALLAPKESGKTVAENNLLLEFIGPETHVHIFSPTFQFDPSWNIAKDYFKQNGVVFDSYPSLYLGDTCILRDLLDEIDESRRLKKKKKKKPPMEKQTAEDVQKKYQEQLKKFTAKPSGKKPSYKTILIPIQTEIKSMPVLSDDDEDDENIDGDSDVDQVGKKYPSDIIVIDDLSDELRRDRNVERLYKRNRHSAITTMVSTQSINDLHPKALANLDYVLIWGGIPERSLKDLHTKIKQTLPLQEFISIYNDATSGKYDFLFIDVWGKRYQKNLG